MEERNELNDIILNRHANSGNSKRKVILAVGVLSVILIGVILIMKTSTSDGTDNLPHAQQGLKSNLPTQSPETKVSQEKQSDDPLFKPVEIVKEKKQGDADLDKIAQKLKQESLTKDNPPVAAAPQEDQQVVQPVAPAVDKTEKTAPIAATKQISKQESLVKTVPQKSVKTKETPVKKEIQSQKETPVKKETQNQKETPIKKETLATKENAPVKSLFTKEAATPKKESTAAAQNESTTKNAKTASDGKYFVQIGSFTKSPGDKYYESIKKLGYAYQSIKINNADKISVGPFKTEADAREALKALRKNVEPGAFVTKK
jgi:DedD protein